MHQQQHYLKKELDELIQNDAGIFHFIQQSSLDGIWYWDLENPQHEWMSEKFWTTLGYDPKNMPHEPSAWKDIVFPEDMQAAETLIQKHLADPQFPYDQEVRYRHAQGTTVWIRCRGLAIRDRQGNPIRMLGAHTDITRIKRKEEELQAFLDEANDLIQSLDQQGNYVYVNRAWCRTLGYSEEEALHLNMFDVIDPEYIPHCQELFGKLMSEREPMFVHVMLRSRTGEAVRAEGNVSVYQQVDGKLVTRGIFRDVTKRYNAEQELRKTRELLEQTSKIARVGGWEMDLENEAVQWTEMTKEIHEVAPDFVPDLAASVSFYKEGTCRDTIERLVAQAIAEGTPFDAELQIVTAGGQVRWVRTIGYAERKEGKTLRLYGTIQDIEEQKQVKEQLMQASEEARQASRAKSEFLANMSHEIRTPLNGVIGFTDLLMKTSMDDTQRQYIQATHHSAHALLDLINDILDFSKIEAGKLELVEEPTDMGHLFTQIGDIVKPKVEDKDIELIFNIDTRLPRYARVDPVRLRQVLINLLSNAVKFTQSGEIEVSVRRDDVQADLYRFAVRDTGVGIDPARQEVIFQAFSQEDASTSRKYGGTGLGLAIINQLLKLMGSQLELESSPGKGSTFSFTLRLLAEDAGSGDGKEELPIQKLLVVDDHEKNCEIIRDVVSLLNIEADTALNGIEALQKLEEHSYDVLIVDYHMPFMNGLQVIEKARETLKLDASKLSVILLHSSSEDSKINEVRGKLKIQQVISKPITVDQLKTALKKFHPESTAGQQDSQPDPASTVSRQDMTLLLVDDNPMNRKLAQSMVKRILPKAAIIEAENGKEAVAAFEQYGADIVFMDIQMPLMNGYEASRKIRELPGGDTASIIALTASAIKGERERCLDAGMDDYMTKPIVMDTLSKYLSRWEDKAPPREDKVKAEAEPSADVHFDLRKFQENVQQLDEDIIMEMLGLLRKQLREDIPRLKSALKEEAGHKIIRSIAHKHKGSTATAGMQQLSALFVRLERIENDQNSRPASLVAEIEEEFKQVEAAILAHFPSLENENAF